MALVNLELILLGLLFQYLHLHCHVDLESKASRTVIFIEEMCYSEGLADRMNEKKFREYARGKSVNVSGSTLDFLDYVMVCDSDNYSLSTIVNILSDDSTSALFGSFKENMCEIINFIAELWRKPLISWNCPRKLISQMRLVPSIEEVADAVVAAAETLSWKSVLIISSEDAWWPLAANTIDMRLLSRNIVTKHILWSAVTSYKPNLTAKYFNFRVIIICASYNSKVSSDILSFLDTLRLSPPLVLLFNIYDLMLPRNYFESEMENETVNVDQVFRNYVTSVQTVPEKKPLKYLIDNGPPISKPDKAERMSSDVWLEQKSSVEAKIKVDLIHQLSSTQSTIFLYGRNLEAEFNNLTASRNRNSDKNTFQGPWWPDVNKDMNNEQGTKKSSKIRVIASNETLLKAGASTRGPNGNGQTSSKYASWHSEGNKTFQLHPKILPDNKVNSVKYRASSTVGSLWASLGNLTSYNISMPKHNISLDAKTRVVRSERITISNHDRNHSVGNLTSTNITRNFLDVNENSGEEILYKTMNKSGRNINKSKHNIRRKNVLMNSLSNGLLDNLLVLSVSDSYYRNHLRKATNNRTDDDLMNLIFDNILNAFDELSANVADEKRYKFLFYDRISPVLTSDKNISQWRLVMSAEHSAGGNVSRYNITRIERHFKEWYSEILQDHTTSGCEDDDCENAIITITGWHVIFIIVGSLAISTFIATSVVTLRNLLKKKNLSKGPNKVVLVANDFIFPQVADSRRVDEGMEAMLCCWLQQLQEFGGPEVEKPDLLKGSVGSLKGLGANVSGPKGPSSNGSIARSNYIVDPKTRYNGDLVQMKYLPNVGSFELRSKSTDSLVVLHGLRHENLNPFIGCLSDPSRPALVYEYCSRGSLEDVLIADEIKLDWTFRLSLLTDLVRGMRYVHGSALRVHGALSSRNCVVDARWVLKLTDYGLASFYDAQGIPPPAKTAKDLLWTAPELLRDAVQRRRGSQTGDVYSFAIVMQEVVVRGEPFCMLSLTPEEIIEKVKRPPPLIRPSVSKGAAPPEAINIMRQCWTEQPDMRPDFNAVHDLFRKLNHGRKVNFIDTMFQMLEKYSNNLEELIRERTEQLDMEKKKTEQLLNRMLPSYVAEKLKLGMPVDPEEFNEVSIYFSDIVGFTAISAHSSPFQVVDLLNDLYTCFDATINAYNVYKVETIGDAYMVVGGLPIRTRDHAEQIATMALDLLHQSGRFKIRHLPKTPLRLRIGLHTGSCCAGVVGLTMPRYCLFGDTVNTASRMESSGAAWRIHLSQATRDKLEAAGGYVLEYRGLTEIKGKGRMPTYWLLGKAGFDKALPTPPLLGLEESLTVEKGNLSVTSSIQPKSEDNSSECSMSPRPGPSISPRLTIPTLSLEVQDSLPITSVNQCVEISTHRFDIDRSLFNVEPTSTQQVIELRKNNFSIKQDDKISSTVIHNNSAETYQRKPTEFLQSPQKTQENRESIIDIETSMDCQDKQSRASHDVNPQAPNVDNATTNGKQLSQFSLYAPVSASEVAAALLGASSTSLASNRFKDITRYKRSTFNEETDLSTPYNHYKCLSPSDSHLNQSGKSTSLAGDGRPNTGRLLKRQFSLDRADDAIPRECAAQKSQPRLFKQNSAGAAPDLERIEEMPMQVNSPCVYSQRRRFELESVPSSSINVSTESLTDSKLFTNSKNKR